jgi:tetratricopeptide (TPR) repeat protein
MPPGGSNKDGMKDFFISYNKSDRAWAEWIAWQLEENGSAVVLQQWEFRPGANFVLEMQRAVAEAKRVISVISPDYVNALYSRPEWASAFGQESSIYERRTLLPVRVRESDLPDFLVPLLYIDLVGLSESEARVALLSGVRSERDRPTGSPAFPAVAKESTAARKSYPGELPPLWNIPYSRNPHFTGRSSLLNKLHVDALETLPGPFVRVLSGLGGVGKTQLAVEYAYRHASEFNAVWWFRASDPASLADEYAQLVQALAPPEGSGLGRSDIVAWAHSWLGQSERWLLIFDGADDRADVEEFLPRAGGGQVIITSRSIDWPVGRLITVTAFTREESVNLLLKLLGSSDEKSVAELAEALGDLPLALVLAASYINKTGISVSNYLDQILSSQGDLLSHASRPLQQNIGASLERSLRHLQDDSPLSMDLINLCAFVAPTSVPKAILQEGLQHLPAPLAAAVAAPEGLDRVLSTVQRYGIISVDKDSFEVNRLAQVVARNSLREEDRRRWAEIALLMINGVFPFNSEDAGTWPECARLLPHAEAVTQYATELDVAPQVTARLLNQVGLYLHSRGQFREAREVLGRAMEVAERAYSPKHPAIAGIVGNLASSLESMGDLSGALELHTRALAIAETAYGKDGPEVARSLNNLGGVFIELGNLEKARSLYERVLSINEATYGPASMPVAMSLNNLGVLLKESGDLQGALDNFQRALSVLQDVGDDSAIATSLSNIGITTYSLGDLQAARKYFERALAADEHLYGSSHPKIATDLMNLGSLYRAMGDDAVARGHYERALRIFSDSLGKSHPHTVAVSRRLSTLSDKS